MGVARVLIVQVYVLPNGLNYRSKKKMITKKKIKRKDKKKRKKKIKIKRKD